MGVLEYLFVSQCGKPYQSSGDRFQCKVPGRVVDFEVGDVGHLCFYSIVLNSNSMSMFCQYFAQQDHPTILLYLAKPMPKNSFISPPKRICKINIFHRSA